MVNHWQLKNTRFMHSKVINIFVRMTKNTVAPTVHSRVLPPGDAHDGVRVLHVVALVAGDHGGAGNGRQRAAGEAEASHLVVVVEGEGEGAVGEGGRAAFVLASVDC